MTAIGTRGTMNIGVTDEMTMREARTWKEQVSRRRKEFGILSSTASTSLLNLLRILPDGVESKNCIVLRKIESSILLWRLPAPRSHMNT